MDFAKVKRFCEQEIKRNTEICIDPDTNEKERIIAAAEIRAYRTVEGLEKYTSWEQHKEEF